MGKYDDKQRRKYMMSNKGNMMLNKGGSGLGCTSIKCTPEPAKPSLALPPPDPTTLATLHWSQQPWQLRQPNNPGNSNPFTTCTQQP